MSLASAIKGYSVQRRSDLAKVQKGKYGQAVAKGVGEIVSDVIDVAGKVGQGATENIEAWEDYEAGQEHLGLDIEKPVTGFKRWTTRPKEGIDFGGKRYSSEDLGGMGSLLNDPSTRLLAESSGISLSDSYGKTLYDFENQSAMGGKLNPNIGQGSLNPNNLEIDTSAYNRSGASAEVAGDTAEVDRTNYFDPEDMPRIGDSSSGADFYKRESEQDYSTPQDSTGPEAKIIKEMKGDDKNLFPENPYSGETATMMDKQMTRLGIKEADREKFLTNISKFSKDVRLMESGDKPEAVNIPEEGKKASSAKGTYQFTDEGVKVAKQRMLNLGYSKKFKDSISDDPRDWNPEQANAMFLANIMAQTGSDDYLRAIGRGDKGEYGGREAYYRFHHTDPTESTRKRAESFFL